MKDYSEFHKAIIKGRTTEVRKFLNNGYQPDSLALVLAIQHRAHGALKLLISAKADLNKPEAYWGYTPLVRALLDGNTTAFSMLLEAGAKVDKRGPYLAPLHHAAERGLIQFAKLCIASGANLELRDGSGNTPLMWAASMGHLQLVKLLLKAGARPHARNAAGRTACELAAENKESKIVRLLEPISHQKPPVRRGIRALIHAVSNQDLTALERCLAKGLDVNRRDRFGRSPLDKAITLGAIPIVERLIEAGIDLNKVGPDGVSFLERALRAEKPAIAKLLLHAGAVPNPPGNKFEDAIYSACGLGDLDLVKLMIRKGSPVRGSGALISAACHGFVEIARFLLSKGADANETSSEGWTPLFWAVLVPPSLSTLYRIKGIKSHIDKGISITPAPKQKTMQELVKVLIENGADVNHADNEGRTPLTYTSSPSLVRILLAAGARLDVEDKVGNKVSHWLRKNE